MNGFTRIRCSCGEDTEYGVFRYDKNGEFCINSCCGNCNAANNVRFCPFCGKKY